MKKKKKILMFFLLLLFICIVLFLLGKSLKNMFIPIYKIEEKKNTVEKFINKNPNDKDILVGWIKVQGTNIDYPIMLDQTGYLDKKYDYAWTNNFIYKDTNLIPIFGHNIRNVSSKPVIGDDTMTRFEQLMSYMYYEFNQNNKYIQLTVNNKDYLYEIFSVGLYDKGSTEYYNKTYSKKELNEYIDKSLKESFFKYNVKVDSNDTILSLITCTRFNGDMSKNFKVDAKLVKNKKKGYNYSVQKTENYKEIEKILKGDGDNV